ncbi:MAG: ExbD/TolR family protein [Burkholderiaceae bacterium]|nr:ExbD/TolR family protein [Burkholderiaceae bacterium]MBS1186154.1 ExbD/TolR family protein [Burkholderiaceae bacterium]
MAGSLRGGRTRKFKSEINVVPYIDVMLVLLVIFMVVAPLTTPGTVNLPTAEKSAEPPTEYIQVSLRADATLEIGIKQSKQGGAKTETMPDRPALLKKLRALHDANPKYAVLIAADKESRYDDVMQLVSEAKKAGIERVGLATR